MLTAEALNGFKDHIKRTLAYAQYKVSDTWYKVDDLNVYVDSKGIVTIDFVIDPALSGSIKVTQVQLYNTAGKLWLNKSENVTRKSTQEGIFYRFTIEITEA